MIDRYITLLDYFVPPVLRDKHQELLRGRICAGWLLAIFGVCLMLLVLTLLTSLIYAIPITQYVIPVLGVGSVYGSLLIAIRTLNSRRWFVLISHITICVGLVIICLLDLVTSKALYPPIVTFIGIVPIAAITILNYRACAFWSLMSALAIMMNSFVDLGAILQIEPKTVLFPTLFTIYCAAAFGVTMFFVCATFTLVNREATLRLSQERSMYKQKSLQDPLTGIANSAGLRTYVNSHIKDATADLCFAMIVIDLDKFKPINDKYGHQVGDQVLQVVAQRLKTRVRESDCVARIGGDEFAIILMGIRNQDNVGTALEFIHNDLTQAIQLGDLSVCVDASLGVAFYPEHGKDLQALCDRADQAMYQSKRTGKTYAIIEQNAAAVARSA